MGKVVKIDWSTIRREKEIDGIRNEYESALTACHRVFYKMIEIPNGSFISNDHSTTFCLDMDKRSGYYLRTFITIQLKTEDNKAEAIVSTAIIGDETKNPLGTGVTRLLNEEVQDDFQCMVVDDNQGGALFFVKDAEDIVMPMNELYQVGEYICMNGDASTYGRIENNPDGDYIESVAMAIYDFVFRTFYAAIKGVAWLEGLSSEKNN